MEGKLFIRVRNWEKFQHYKDRRPIWIKVYNELLDDYDFTSLPDASKAHLVSIWMLASRCRNEIPCDAEWIGSRIGATEPVDLEELTERGFLQVTDKKGDVVDASDALASRYQDAIDPLAIRYQPASTEEEKEEEEDTSSLRSDESDSPSVANATSVESSSSSPETLPTSRQPSGENNTTSAPPRSGAIPGTEDLFAKPETIERDGETMMTLEEAAKWTRKGGRRIGFHKLRTALVLDQFSRFGGDPPSPSVVGKWLEVAPAVAICEKLSELASTGRLEGKPPEYIFAAIQGIDSDTWRLRDDRRMRVPVSWLEDRGYEVEGLRGVA